MAPALPKTVAAKAGCNPISAIQTGLPGRHPAAQASPGKPERLPAQADV